MIATVILLSNGEVVIKDQDKNPMHLYICSGCGTCTDNGDYNFERIIFIVLRKVLTLYDTFSRRRVMCTLSSRVNQSSELGF
jgi:hypothetical protein